MDTTRFTRHGLRRSFLIAQQENLDCLSRLRDPKAEYESLLRELSSAGATAIKRHEPIPGLGGTASRAA